MLANYKDVWIGEKAFKLFKINVFTARNVTRIFLGEGHQSLTFLSEDFPAELI